MKNARGVVVDRVHIIPTSFESPLAANTTPKSKQLQDPAGIITGYIYRLLNATSTAWHAKRSMALSSRAPFPIKAPETIHAMALGEVCLRGCVLVIPIRLPIVPSPLKNQPIGNAELANGV
jgi:hypothetical protein